jgi:hypothetical protein
MIELILVNHQFLITLTVKLYYYKIINKLYYLELKKIKNL